MKKTNKKAFSWSLSNILDELANEFEGIFEVSYDWQRIKFTQPHGDNIFITIKDIAHRPYDEALFGYDRIEIRSLDHMFDIVALGLRAPSTVHFIFYVPNFVQEQRVDHGPKANLRLVHSEPYDLYEKTMFKMRVKRHG